MVREAPTSPAGWRAESGMVANFTSISSRRPHKPKNAAPQRGPLGGRIADGETNWRDVTGRAILIV